MQGKGDQCARTCLWTRISLMTLCCVCVRETGVLRLFQKSFSHITTVAACCMRRDIAANTDTPCLRNKAQMHHPVTLSWDRANPSWLHTLNAERSVRKQQVAVLTPFARPEFNLRPPDCEANALTSRPPLPARYVGLVFAKYLSDIFRMSV